MQKHSSQKPGTPSMCPSKSIIINWLKSLFPDLPLATKIEDFGDGVIYCRLLSHHYGNPPHSKITWLPKNEYEYANNLKHVQTALLQLGIPISFDVGRVSKRKFLENWALINAFYRHMSSQEETSLPAHDQSSGSSYVNNSNGLLSSFGQNPTPTAMSQKHQRRPAPTTSSYAELQPKYAPKPPMAAYYSQLAPQCPPIYEPANFGYLTQNSLQLSQYLKQNINAYNTSPAKGKWSVGSQIFQNNHSAVVDRVKEILLKNSHDTEKVRQIKMLLGMPVDEEEVIKIEDDEAGPIVFPIGGQKLEMRSIPQEKEDRTTTDFLAKESVVSKDNKLSVSKTPKKPFKI